MAYVKILVSKVMELREDLGLVIEVNAGANGKVNDLVFWLQYKDANGAWQYKGSQGATGIRIPLVEGVEKFIIDNVKASVDASNKFNATNINKTSNGFDVNSLSDEDKAILLALLIGNAKATPSEPDLSLENILNNAKGKGKGKGKK